MTRALPLSIALLVVLLLPASHAGADVPLDLEGRVACELALERTRAESRIWPESNPGSRPLLGDVAILSIRSRLSDRLARTRALEEIWGLEIHPADLQAEIDRMVADTRNPELLGELFAALDDDPHRIAECLARPNVLARKLRRAFLADEEIHGPVRRRIADVAATAALEELEASGARIDRVRWQRGERAPLARDAEGRTLSLDPDTWDRWGRTLALRLDVEPPTDRFDPRELPARTRTGLEADDERFFVQEILASGPGWVEVATASWPRTELEAWWGENRDRFVRTRSLGETFPGELDSAEASYRIPELDRAAVARAGNPRGLTGGGEWTALETSASATRRDHTAIWTGAEMIVWGGSDGSGDLGSGHRYHPATDTWGVLTSTSAPSARSGHHAVWTGSEMIVWGGPSLGGARYDPLRDAWTPMTTNQDPGSRSWSTVVWTGSEMLAWAGATLAGDGYRAGRYDPVADDWDPIPAVPTDIFPVNPFHHAGVWTGSELLVWGGFRQKTGGLPDQPSDRGAAYDPDKNTWREEEPGGVAVGRGFHSAVWTGEEAVFWGGRTVREDPIGYRQDGWIWDADSGNWSPITTTGAPSARRWATVVWSGSEVLVWGGEDAGGAVADGGRWNPSTGSWSPIATADDPSPRLAHTAIWADDEMIVWGGEGDGSFPVSGGRYDPSVDDWTTLSTFDPLLSARFGHSAVWTGIEMLVWGGSGLGGELANGASYDPALHTWELLGVTGRPSARSGHTAVWTGSEMIVWGGDNGSGKPETGGRYDPVTRIWTPTPTASAPPGRTRHSAVWTGQDLVVWGGLDAAEEPLGGGKRYDPVVDGWGLILSSGAPSPRYGHTAVWTGSEVIVWGGTDGTDFFENGARYTPGVSWAPLADIPPNIVADQNRAGHAAVWFPSYDPTEDGRMVLWGGYDGAGDLDDRDYVLQWHARDGWSLGGQTDEPESVRDTAMVRTGLTASLFGGIRSDNQIRDVAAVYNPFNEIWTADASPGSPSARFRHSGMSFGSLRTSKAIFWGGFGTTGTLEDGGVYSPPADFVLYCIPDELRPVPGSVVPADCVLHSTHGYDGSAEPVSLSCQPDSIGCIGLGTVTPNPNQAAFDAFTFVVPAGLGAGPETVSVDAVGDGRTRTWNQSFDIQDFSVACDVDSIGVGPGEQRFVSCSIDPVAGFSGPVDLSCSSPSGGCSVSPDPVTVPGTGSSAPFTLEIAPPGDASGSETILIEATARGGVRIFEVDVDFSTPDFGLQCPSSVSLDVGELGSMDCAAYSFGGFADPVDLACQGSSGLPCAPLPSQVTPPADGSAPFDVRLDARNLSGGYFTSQVRGTSDGVARDWITEVAVRELDLFCGGSSVGITAGESLLVGCTARTLGGLAGSLDLFCQSQTPCQLVEDPVHLPPDQDTPVLFELGTQGLDPGLYQMILFGTLGTLQDQVALTIEVLDPGAIFSDGFESGDISGWDSSRQ